MCRVFGITVSAYYAARARGQSARQRDDRMLGETITRIFDEHRRSYGAPRVHQQLRADGQHVARKRVARIMRQQGLRAAAPRRWVRTTDARHDHPIAENVLDRDFTAAAPDRKWAGDITYIETAEGFLYLAVVLDLFSRRVVGWAMSDRIDRQLSCSAIVMALRVRRPAAGLIVHSDRGVQYAAGDYRQLLADWSITPSMSRRGNCWDNAPSESFFATLKKEHVYRCPRYQTRDEARASIFEYIEVFYNRVRRHSYLEYVSPVAFEQQWTTCRVRDAGLSALLPAPDQSIRPSSTTHQAA